MPRFRRPSGCNNYSGNARSALSVSSSKRSVRVGSDSADVSVPNASGSYWPSPGPQAAHGRAPRLRWKKCSFFRTSGSMGGGKLEVRQNLYSIAPRIVFTLSQICRFSAKLAGANPKLKLSLVNPSKIYSPRMIQLEVSAYSTPPPMLKPFNHLFSETVNAFGNKQQVPVTDSFVFANVQPPAIYSSVFG